MENLKQIILYLLLDNDVLIKYNNRKIYITIKDFAMPSDEVCFVYSLYNMHYNLISRNRFINKKYIPRINFNSITLIEKRNITGYWFNEYRNIIISKKSLNKIREYIYEQS